MPRWSPPATLAQACDGGRGTPVVSCDGGIAGQGYTFDAACPVAKLYITYMLHADVAELVYALA